MILSATGAQASVITEWNFNSVVADGNTGTGSTAPGIGAGVADNANFAFRIVASFAPYSLGYLACNAVSNYAASGTWRFDMVSFTGSPVPVPAAFWMMGSGLVWLPCWAYIDAAKCPLPPERRLEPAMPRLATSTAACKLPSPTADCAAVGRSLHLRFSARPLRIR